MTSVSACAKRDYFTVVVKFAKAGCVAPQLLIAISLLSRLRHHKIPTNLIMGYAIINNMQARRHVWVEYKSDDGTMQPLDPCAGVEMALKHVPTDYSLSLTDKELPRCDNIDTSDMSEGSLKSIGMYGIDGYIESVSPHLYELYTQLAATG